VEGSRVKRGKSQYTGRKIKKDIRKKYNVKTGENVRK
jgi:hypothetical protein